MKELLEDIIFKLRSGAYTNEEHVRLGVAVRLLQALGWDIWNPEEVNTEFCPVRSEDSTRVDIALFAQRSEPAVFLEVKGAGKIGRNLPEIERQMRDYNRNMSAIFSVLTDGRHWKFYLSRAGGEFKQKLFKEIDLLSEPISFEDIELALHAFLSKAEIVNGGALREAEQYLSSTRRERVMRNELPLAKREIETQPDLSLVKLLVRRVADAGHKVSDDEARVFIHESASRSDAQEPYDPYPVPAPIRPDRIPTQASKGEATLVLRRHGKVVARGYAKANREFVVLEGSRAAAEIQPSGKSGKRVRSQLVSQGILRKDGDGYLLTENYSFSSSSNAAVVFLGVSASGPREWTPE